VRAVLDPNVLISAALSSRGAPARALSMWVEGDFELMVSPLVIAELERALSYPKLRKLIPAEDAERFVGWLQRAATLVDDPNAPPPVRSRDPGDDYLLALAAQNNAALVSGDGDLLDIDRAGLPIYSPADFVAVLAGGS
jgi:putative PIN family toxin of toxin-antitoxin system